MFEIKGKNTTVKVMIDDIDPETMRQIIIMANHPSATNPIAIMPDAHAGKGCCIGFTMRASDKVVPNFVGVDIGCGMLSAKISAEKITNGQLKNIDKELRDRVPMGMSALSNPVGGVDQRLSRVAGESVENIEKIVALSGMKGGRFWNSIGTLGGGNHFIEFGIDEAGSIWVTVHTGSRNFGKMTCEFFDKKAKESLKPDQNAYVEQLKARVQKGEIKSTDIGPLLGKYGQENHLDFDVNMSAYAEGELLKSYLYRMNLAQAYAVLNRQIIVETILDVIGNHVGRKVRSEDSIETIHNFISMEDCIIRKGAVASYVGQRMVIPFNMRDGLLICEGLSNPEWNFSAPHGAGRIMSRSRAKAEVSLEEYKKSMEGVFTTSVGRDTLDESPMAYKDAAMIEAAIAPTAKILHRVKPIYNVKSGGER